MTKRNRECKVQVHALVRVCTYSRTICACTCTHSARRAVTIGDNLGRRLSGIGSRDE